MLEGELSAAIEVGRGKAWRTFVEVFGLLTHLNLFGSFGSFGSFCAAYARSIGEPMLRYRF
jgi:hypothetical protein